MHNDSLKAEKQAKGGSLPRITAGTLSVSSSAAASSLTLGLW